MTKNLFSRILKLTLISFLLSDMNASVARELSEDEIKAIREIIKQAPRASVLGLECQIDNNISQKIKELYKVAVDDYSKRDDNIKENFINPRNELEQRFGFSQLVKSCLFDRSKTKEFINDISTELSSSIELVEEDIKAKTERKEREQKEKIDAEKLEQERIERIKAERLEQERIEKIQAERREEERAIQLKKEQNERIRNRAYAITESCSDYVVRSRYKGGKNIGATLKDFEFFESLGTIRVSVSITWSGVITGESGYGAEGNITMNVDDNDCSTIKWNPTWTSSKLDDTLQGLNMLELMLKAQGRN